jgi:hypothetical protein
MQTESMTNFARIIFCSILLIGSFTSFAQTCLTECKAAWPGYLDPYTRYYNKALGAALEVPWDDNRDKNQMNAWCKEIMNQDSQASTEELLKWENTFSKEHAPKGYPLTPPLNAYFKYKRCMVQLKPERQRKSDDESAHSSKSQSPISRKSNSDSISEADIKRAVACMIPERPGNPAHILGYVRSVCRETINFTYCLEPDEGVYSAMTCGVKFYHGRLTVGAIDDGTDTRGTPYWFACLAPAKPRDVMFFRGKGISAYCE